MKIYHIKFKTVVPEHDGVTVTHQEFATSDGAASKRITEIKKEFKDTLDDKPERTAIDVPTTRTELVEWLNKHALLAGVVFP